MASAHVWFNKRSGNSHNLLKKTFAIKSLAIADQFTKVLPTNLLLISFGIKTQFAYVFSAKCVLGTSLPKFLII